MAGKGKKNVYVSGKTREGSLNDDINRVAKAAMEKWGLESQSVIGMEECAELIQAISKVRRAYIDSEGTMQSLITGAIVPEKTLFALFAECADVVIMIEQFAQLFGRNRLDEAVKIKAARLAERLRT